MTLSLAIALAAANLVGGLAVGLAIGLAGRSRRTRPDRPAAALVLAELDLELEQAGVELDEVAADLREAAGDEGRLRTRLSKLSRWSGFLTRRLTGAQARLAASAEPAGGFGSVADSLPLVRAAADELGQLSSLALREGDASAVLAAAARLAAANRRLRRELEEVKGRLAESEARISAAERDARIDPLTRLPNRRSLTERLAGFQSALQRGREPYAVALFDLDGFKAFNDAHGHAAGDAVLGVFAAVLRDSVRPFDHPARWGGEEFAVILPGADTSGAAAAAERVRRAAAAARVIHNGRELRFTVSAGAAAARPDREIDATLAAADAALYVAKAAGRNRVESEAAGTSGATASDSVQTAGGSSRDTRGPANS